MPVYHAKKFVKFGSVTLELTELICECLVQHGKKLHIVSNIFQYTGPIFAIFSLYESALRADDGSVPYFPTRQETLPWQPNSVAVMKAN